MADPDFSAFRALSFDCYGTLIDWESGIAQAVESWAAAAGASVSRAAGLAAFAEFETIVQGEHTPAWPYPEVLAETLRRMGGRLGVAVTSEDAAAFGSSVGDWPAFPDSAEALARLAERYSLIVVSNIDDDSFARSNRRLGVTFDRIITAEEVGSYKPRLPHFDALFAYLDEIGLERSQLLHVAQSLYHDHAPARELGLASVWIDRSGGAVGGATPDDADVVAAPEWRYGSLAAFADAAVVGVR